MDYRITTQINSPCDYRDAINASEIEMQNLLQDQLNANVSYAQLAQLQQAMNRGSCRATDPEVQWYFRPSFMTIGGSYGY